MASLADTLLSGAVVEIQASGLPPVRVALDDKSPPSALMRALSPKVTIKRGDLVLYSAAPYGEPRPVPAVVWLTVVGVAVLLLVIALSR
jgi:hypothetical protein